MSFEEAGPLEEPRHDGPRWHGGTLAEPGNAEAWISMVDPVEVRP